MYCKNFYFLSLLTILTSFQTLNAQNTTLFGQVKQPDGSMNSGSSAISRSIHIADDFSITEDAKINTITFEGAQIANNLPSILLSTNFYIVEGETLTGAPGTENVIYQSVGSKDGATLISNGYAQDFVIDLTSKNINLQANKKYWVIFSANINAATLSNITDWHNYPGYNTVGTSLGKRYTNGAWSNLVSGLTFKVEGTTALGTTETFANKINVFAATMVSQILEVKLLDFKSISVFDFTGKQVLNSDKVKNNISFLVPGIYLGVVTTKNGKTITSKFIKK